MDQTVLVRASDHELLLGGVEQLRTENSAVAERAARLLVFFRRHEAAELAKQGPEGPGDGFALTAREVTEVEASELWAIPASWVRRQLHNALWINDHFPYLWDLALAGGIDGYRTALIAETTRHNLDTPEEYAALVARLTPYLVKHQRPDGMVTCSHKQLRNKLSYILRVLRTADAEEQFRTAHANRDITTIHGTDTNAGISWLTIAGTTDQITAAAHRLTLSARAARAAGDPRTIAQLKADLALDLVTTGSSTDQDGNHVPVPSYARPVINLTVPIQTVMGLADHPGMLSGGQIIPAGLARVIAQQPGSTWHRMLTDQAGVAVEVSTTSYQPTPALWAQVTARSATCYRSQCDHASTDCDLDHRTRWPEGTTTSNNLSPACRTDHRAKHSPGFAIIQTETGSFALETPTGFLHAVPDTTHPSTDEWEPVPTTIQFSATELHKTLTTLREQAAANRPPRIDLTWELDLRFGYTA
jgi:hypothetical protein